MVQADILNYADAIKTDKGDIARRQIDCISAVFR
jgi:hypothetical protein